MTDERFLKLWPFKALRPPRLQFLTNSCRFLLALFGANFSRHLLLFISAVRICSACLPVLQLRFSLSRDICELFSQFPSFIFRFASFVPTFFPLRAFLSLPTCVCILFSLVIMFDVPLRCFVPPLVFYEIYLFVVVFFPLTSALICFIRMAALSRAKHLTSLYFAIIFSVVF